MQVTKVLEQFLDKFGRFPIYKPELECQVNVVQGKSKIQKERYYLWTDGITRWKPIRIPYSDGTYRNPEFFSDITKFAKIGLSGWNWKEKVSEWVGFDFDSITNHKASGLSHEELIKIREEVKKIPWVTIRKSTSGNGLHLYVFFKKPPPVESRKEHKMLAKAVLDLMAGRLSLPLQSKVDVFGGILWIWSKNQGEAGFELVKEGSKLALIPDWKSSVPLNKNVKRLSQSIPRHSLSPDHLKLLEWLKENNEYWHWNGEKHLLVTHTSSLLKAHIAMKLKGPFDTLAKGKKDIDWNCFMYPLKEGWVVRRFTQGTQEEITWGKDSGGWTRCFFDCPCNFFYRMSDPAWILSR